MRPDCDALGSELGMAGILESLGKRVRIVNGQATRSCVTPVQSVGAADVTTLEGLGTAEKPHALQQAFIDEQAAQCGFCLSGVILSAKALLDRNPRATDAQLQQALSGVLCRCFGQVRMMRAIRRYARSREVRS